MMFSLLLFASLLLVGQLCFSLGDSIESLNLMLLGRALFGLGGESMAVAQSAVVTQWFQGKELAMALGVNLSFSRLGSVRPQMRERDVDVVLMAGLISVC